MIKNDTFIDFRGPEIEIYDFDQKCQIMKIYQLGLTSFEAKSIPIAILALPIDFA